MKPPAMGRKSGIAAALVAFGFAAGGCVTVDDVREGDGAAPPRDPLVANHYVSRGLDAERRGDVAMAAAKLERARLADPSNEVAALALASVRVRQARTEDAALALGHLRAARPPSAALALAHGRALELAGAPGDARRAYEDALALAPDARLRGEAYVALVELASADGDDRAALAWCERWVRACPDSAEAREAGRSWQSLLEGGTP